jgi:cell division protein ZapD
VTQPTITFEHPLNERIRTFLRTEYLFQQLKYRYQNLTATWDSRDCVTTLIELYNLIERTEFRGELHKEIERHLNSFQRMSNTPAIDHRALDRVVGDLEKASDILKTYSAKQGFFPRESDLLNSIRQRLMIPGGTCSFDIPAFHYWLNSPVKNRQAFLKDWIEVLEPLERTLQLVLQLTRQSNVPMRETAAGGAFQKSLQSQAMCQLIRISLRSELGVYPEISANKLRVNIRFLLATGEHTKSMLVNKDIPFELTCCMI